MKKELMNIIPIETNNKGIWYLDISKLSLSELIKLRKELETKSNASIRSLDAIIHHNTSSSYEDMNFKKRDMEKKKQGYRNRKVLIRMRRQGR